MGVDRLVAGYDGRLEFTAKKQADAVWHCFWGKMNDKDLALTCTASTNTDQKRELILSVNPQGQAELREGATLDGAKLLATFTRIDENPSPNK